MKNYLLMLLLACSFGTVAIGCADEVNAKTDDITTDNDDDTTEGAAGSGDTDVDVDECEAACNDDACVAGCSD